jgi:hypothetical protein
MHAASPWLTLTMTVLATWRLAHLVAHEDGPFDAVVFLRERAGHGMFGRLMDCPYCLSLWFAAPAALLLATRLPEWCVAWLAISGGASLLERLSAAAAAIHLHRHGADDHALLRPTTSHDDDDLATPAHEHRAPSNDA